MRLQPPFPRPPIRPNDCSKGLLQKQIPSSVDSQSGEARIEKEAREFTGVMATIHTGEHTGYFGRRVIDVSAVLLILSSLSGIILWTSLSIRRRTGLIWLASGALLILVILVRLVGYPPSDPFFPMETL
jgi:hypothetical protein